ncbi:unnamed protein product [Hymenolepis diminuta]|uniref:Uncharacterized protein n=1 Tax=Hymenolepis diminuta TaxID=6216 RepID=A0A564YM87_HYMDI|nr:unnamed protein product [Hymenolepis diminuta]
MLPQIKASETERLRSELEQVLSSVTENVDILNRSILNQQSKETQSCTELVVEEDVEKLLKLFQKFSNTGVQSPIASVRLNDALKKYSGNVLSSTLSSVIDSKLVGENFESLSNINIHYSEDTEERLIDKLRFEHILSYSNSIELFDRCLELRHLRDELLTKVNSSSIQSQAQILGLVAKQKYLKSSLKSFQFREEHLNTLKRRMRESAKFSAEFNTLYTEKKNKLKSLNSYLESLWKSLTSSKLRTLESYSRALNSSNRLSNLVKDIWSHNDGKAINLASSAAMNISQCSYTPYLNNCITLPLYQEICKRLNSAPLITPIGRIVDRIQSIVADCKNIDLINEELSRSLGSLKSLRDGLHNSLETSRNAEKEICLAMAGLLKKISVNCAKLTDSQKRLDDIWNYWLV